MDFCDLRKHQSNYIVERCLDYLKSTNIPPHVLAFLLKSFHLYGPIGHYGIVTLAPLKMAVIAVAAYWAVGIAFIYFGGCLLSKIEYALEDDKDKFINVVDPILYLLGWGTGISKSTQWWLTISIIGLYTVTITYIISRRLS